MKLKFVLLCLATSLCAVAQKTPDVIDMGTSVKWAAEALGTDEAHPYGDLYTFGAVEPYPGVSYFLGHGFNLEQWGGNPEADAATAILGKGFSTPSKAQFEELIAVCDFKYTYDYTLKRDKMEVTSKITGNKITLYGAGSWVVGNDHTNSGEIYLETSTLVPDKSEYIYYFSPKPASENRNALLERNAPTSFAYQIWPVFNESDVVKASEVIVSSEKLILAAGSKSTITATIIPADASNKTVVWKSSDPTVATVNENGEVEALQEGECEITATTTDGTNISSACALTVVAPTQGMDFVDMGVSVLWGTHEIGASNFLDAGTYYAWGTVANANNYLAAVAESYPIADTSAPITGVKRDASDSSKPYDVATDVLGDNWQTPTYEKFQELAENCKITYEKENDVYFTRFTSKINGNHIDFKAHGYLRETSPNPQMATSILLQTSDGATNNIYSAANISTSSLGKTARYCFWLISIRPVYVNNSAGVDEVSDDVESSCVYDVYDISGRRVVSRANYPTAVSRLNSGVYIFTGSNGKRFKIAL